MMHGGDEAPRHHFIRREYMAHGNETQSIGGEYHYRAIGPNIEPA